MKDISSLLKHTEDTNAIYAPLLLRLSQPDDKEKFGQLLEDQQVSFINDEIYGQLQELVKSEHPSIKIKPDEYPALIEKHLDGRDIQEYGTWVYYPWNRRMVHLLDEEEFIEVRTNRNRYKITREEQALLRTKKIGIVGLSVGQSIALTMAMERTCGELRLADFDTAELSNLNRIRTGTQNLGLNKTVIAAREILEMDPYLKIKIFNDGLHAGNMDQFFLGEGKLDLFVEVCDGLDIKIESRFKARELQIPVVMDTNDRGMLDVERYDLEPGRAILHGLADGLDPKNIKDLSNEQKIPFVLKMIGAESISTRLKASMLEVEQSINTWPQLASSVTLGGALTTDVARRILLDHYHDSGRYYIDLEQLVKDHEDKEVLPAQKEHPGNPFQPIEEDKINTLIDRYFQSRPMAPASISEAQLDQIMEAAIAAPSAGNNQPWKWVFAEGMLFLFHDKYRSWSWGDYYEMGSHMGLGGAIENVHLQSAALGLNDEVVLFPLENEPEFIAAIRFSAAAAPADSHAPALAAGLYTRHTNRKVDIHQPIDTAFYTQLQQAVPEAAAIRIFFTQEQQELDALSEIIGECDKVRLLDQQGHEEFYHEIRWNREEAEKTRDGVDLGTVDITQGEIAGFKVAGDWKAVELLAAWDKGDAFKKLSLKAVKQASGIIVFSIPDFTHTGLINAGRAIQRAWIFANQQGVSVHPMLSPAFFFNRLIHGEAEALAPHVAEKLHALRKKFLEIFPLETAGQKELKEVFIMKVNKAAQFGSPSLRKDKAELFYKKQ